MRFLSPEHLFSAAIFVAFGLAGPAYSASFRISIAEDAKVGGKAVGLVCFPKQPLRWSKQYRPDSEEVEQIAQRQLGDLANEAAIEIRELRLNVCQPYWGLVGSQLGSPQELRGEVEMRVRWTFGSPAVCLTGLDSHVKIKIPAEMRGGIAAAVLLGIEASAAEAARSLVKGSECALPTGKALEVNH